MKKISRRGFIGTMVGAAGAAAAGGLLLFGRREALSQKIAGFVADGSIKKASDKVMLGKTGIAVSLAGIGTGSGGWAGSSDQTRLGQEEFTRQLRYAFDNGITFYDLADQYGSHPFFAKAMRGLNRDKYVIQTKTTSREPARARADIDRFLNELGTDYIDSLIIHNVTEGDWTKRFEGVMEVFAEAKKAGKIRAHGVTCHSFAALTAAAASDWAEINQVRWNARQSHMDADVETARALFERMRRKGQGMIGMKVFGQGSLVRGDRPLTPLDCYRFQIESGVVDAFVVGVQSVAQIDQMLDGTAKALAASPYKKIAA